MVHISQLGSTIAVDTTKLRDGELEQLLETLATEAKTRIQTRRQELDDNKNEQVEFLSKCRKLVQTVIPGPLEANNRKPVEKKYQLFENVVATLQVHIQNTKENKKEETSKLLR